MLGRYLVKDHLDFRVPMAPTFWMLVQDNEKPTLDDFAREDARLRKRLDKFEGCKNVNSEWPNDEVWEWTNVNDKTQPIFEERANQAITR